jgi:periplasmic copper chaperone A
MTPHRSARRTGARAAIAVLATTSLVLAACGDDDTSADDGDAAAAAAEIGVSGAWARTSPAVADAGAVYLELTNTGELDDALVGASVDISVAGVTEIHETKPVGDDGDGTDGGDGMDGGTDDGDGMDGGSDDGDRMDGGDGMDGGGMMEMRPVDRIEVPAGETVALEPGGYHVMLKELVAPLEDGATVEVTLVFEESDEQLVTADVGDAAP